MIKERVWPVRAMYMLIAAALVISLIITAAPALKVSADPGLSEWDRVSTPSEEDWVLSPRSYIVDAATVPGGEVAYAIVKQWKGGTNFYLLKSTDSAATWDDITDGLEDALDDDEGITELLKVACDPEDPDFVAVALALNVTPTTYTYVFISEDGGATFRNSGEVEDGGVALPNTGVFALAVAPEEDGMRNIAIGGTNVTAALLFRCLTLGDIGTGWDDATDYDGWDDEGAFTSLAVVAIHIAPSWGADNTILVATANNTAVQLQYGTWGTIEGWNADSNVAMDAVPIITGVTVPWSYLGPATASITTPLDFSGRYADKRYVWVNVNYVHSVTGITGTIFRVKNAAVNPIGWQVEDEALWLTNVSYMGYVSEGKAIAGVLGDGLNGTRECCDTDPGYVYRNDNIVNMDICCYDWEPACKPPSGIGALAVFYVSEDKAYAVTLGPYEPYDESAWSVSFDDGDIWNQLSLVDTHIDFLSDVAVSPDCNKTMLVSVNLYRGCGACDSVWLHAENLPEAEEYSGKWLRTWFGQLEGFDLADFDETILEFFEVMFDEESLSGEFELGLLRLAPEETTGDTVYLVDVGTANVYWNTMETLGCWEQGTASVDQIVDLAVKDKETIYALDFSGTVAMSDDYAVGWHPAVDTMVDNGWTIAVWGDDILVGGCDGEVSYSADGGETFTDDTELKDVPVAAEVTFVTVAFDSYFDVNDTIYAAVAGGQGAAQVTIGGVYRWVIDESDEWKDLGADEDLAYTGLVLDNADGNPMTSADTGGVIYASYIYLYSDSGTYTDSGVARRLNPGEDIICVECVEWDYLDEGLTYSADGSDYLVKQLFIMMPDALKICGCLTPDSNSKLFAIGLDVPKWEEEDAGYDMEKAMFGTVWSFEDCFAKAAPDLISPADDATMPADPCDCIPLPFTIKWDRQCNACSYDIQLALDEDFTEIIVDEAHVMAGESPSYFVLEEGLLCEFTYYWRVRAADAETGQNISSWWSDTRSFTVAPGPGAGVALIAPENGATGMAITDIPFSWSGVASADEYDWVLSANSDLSSPIATVEGLTTTATTYTGTALDYETPYFWQVTALKEGGAISMSAVGTFTTAPTGAFCCPQDGLCFDTQAELKAHTAEAHPAQPVTPVWVWVIIAIGAVLVIVVIVLIFRTRRV